MIAIYLPGTNPHLEDEVGLKTSQRRSTFSINKTNLLPD